jgi:predicted nucleic acid-binding protein
VLAEFLNGAHHAGGNYLREALQLAAGRDVVPLDRECGALAGQLRAELRRTGVSVAMIGAMIAAIALRHHQVLVNRDVGSVRIPGLAMESY